MQKLANYVQGKWIEGDGEGHPIYDAVTGEVFLRYSTEGLDIPGILEYGRKVGNPALRKMTFFERGLMLKKLALHLFDLKEKFYELSYRTGATRRDSWVDIEGGIGNLFANASLRRKFANQTFHVEGEPIDLSRGGGFMGHHIMVPREGVAVHINAYNFPVWGMLEKTAVNWMAGMPAVVKPAPSTSYLTEAVVREIIQSGILPEGALQLLCGEVYTILDTVTSQDVVTFTGSATTGRLLKSHRRIIDEAVPFNMEADSLNSSVLGPDAVPGTPEFDLFIKEVRNEITMKCGQRCTAIRRIMVPENLVEDVQIALGQGLEKTTIGDPRQKGVRMGALVSREQVEEVRSRVKELTKTAEIVYGSLDSAELVHADYGKGAFLSPILLRENDPMRNHGVHEIEAFGPVSSIVPYKDLDQAIELTKMGKGSLVCSIATADDKIARDFTVGAATHHGRILVLNRESAVNSTGHGSPLATLVHGGPGRAGGGEEMGGMRGVMHYLQRCAIQGSPTTVTAITGIFQQGAHYTDAPEHPFRYHFEDIQPGMSIKTHKRTVTDMDIIAFGNVTWDHFYAHTDITSLGGTIFEKRTAHGYFILSAAAGLFVYPNKGPVIANYGLDECRFLRPIYHNDTLYVRLTCKEKVERDSKGKELPAGVVKWHVEVFDQYDELVATAIILTLVQKRCPLIEVSKHSLPLFLEKLKADTPAKFGKMTAQHMVEHLRYYLKVALGQITQPLVTKEEMLEAFQDSLYTYRKFPKGTHDPELKEGNMRELEFDSLEAAKKAFLETFAEYELHYIDHMDFEATHPVFGSMNKEKWDLFNRKHYQHHFEQFGLV
ncbi:MAG: phenylacetic acid degradation bifunctional protein PaaZ [Bacteroidia bacterium]|nr:phenylacetic acid degradation bifunctional protein PaaZ [Bacteroidia bacterium]